MWILLAASLLFSGFRINIAIVLLTVATGWGVLSGIIELAGLCIMALVAVVALLLHRNRHHCAVETGAELLLLFIAITLLGQFAPGFNDHEVLEQVHAGKMSRPFSMTYSFDKALLPFVLLVAMPSLFLCRPRKNVTKRHWVLLTLSMPLLLLMQVINGDVKFEMHLPAWFWPFCLDNLFFVSLAEEALFRGYLQRRLTQLSGPVPGLLLSALLFGISHLSCGELMVAYASLAGIIYGLAWMWSGRLWVSTLFHFSLNVIHLLFFTFPGYQD